MFSTPGFDKGYQTRDDAREATRAELRRRGRLSRWARLAEQSARQAAVAGEQHVAAAFLAVAEATQTAAAAAIREEQLR